MNKNEGREKQSEALAPNTTAAIQQLIKVSRQLVDLSERETQALVQKDMLSFAIMQDEKEQLAARYTKASEEFRSRIDEFRSIEPQWLQQLEKLQTALAEKTRANNLIVENIKARAQLNTQKTLLTVQELAQTRPVMIAERVSQEGV